ncbi:MAG: glycosyltransferase [Phycisphaerae bacterium]|nr:glycosyltransferase [Saprospiraceae bacterium]
MSIVQNPTILVAPLNWGLGHATRCMPLIKALERMGAKVVLASDGAALHLLRAEFPHLPAFELPSYRIRYQTNSMVWNIARQMPRITYAIRAEQWATERLLREHSINGIISDNRYGCFSPSARSVILTHQIHLRVPNAALQWAANQVLRSALRKFDSVWIPDVVGEPNLAGDLSHPPLKGFDSTYIGLLSRFTVSHPVPNVQRPMSNVQYPTSNVAIVLSGPEPQRTYLEHILLEQALALPHKFVFVKGKTQTKEHHIVAENVEVVSFLTSSELNQLLQSSQVVVCRAGYSSLMDLAALADKKAILIPTPGQTEQEYLGALFARQGIFICQKQEEVDLETGLREIEKTTGFPPHQFDIGAFETVLEGWLHNLPQDHKDQRSKV